jgi:hypothetical protein
MLSFWLYSEGTYWVKPASRLDIRPSSPKLFYMVDTAVLASIAHQMMKGAFVDLNGERLPVRRTSGHRLRTLSFTMNRRQYQAIEQNPEKPSRWGQLARDGHQVVQFKDVETNKFVAVAVDDKVRIYGAGDS